MPAFCFNWQLTGDIHEEVLNHNRLLDKTGDDMDASRGILSGTVNRFKMGLAARLRLDEPEEQTIQPITSAGSPAT
ncbi:hypothetical protein V2J09_015818 [Rumex salicifolius]